MILMEKITAEKAERIKAALKALLLAAQDLGNVLDDAGYVLSASCPDFLSDVDDFSYELSSFYEDEVEVIDEKTEGPKLKSA